jgi:antitoxin component YwqK of YwqJK toxin-antitoxin module
MRIPWIVFFMTIYYSCSQKDKIPKEIIKVNTNWLDSIKQKSDTSWTKLYRNNEFVTAEYYVDRKDSIVTQLMKDATGLIRQINIAKYDNIRLFFAEYYANGQLKARLPLDEAGKYNGLAKYYFEDGNIKSIGLFNHGMYAGEWKNYNEKGKLVSRDQYDSNGQLIKTISAQ